MEPILSLKNVCSYYDKVQVLYDINVDVYPGEIVSVIGANGAGKSTMMKTIMGLVHMGRGEVTFDGKKLNRMHAHKICKAGIGYVPEGREVFPNMTVLENLEMGAYCRSYGKYAELIEYVITNDLCDSLIVTGTTGEASLLTFDERVKLFETAVKASAGRKPVIAGTGCASTKETIALTNKAYDLGIELALIVCPFYNKPTQEGLYLHYKTIAENTKANIMLYNIPIFVGVNLEAETVGRLAAIPNIVGVKDEAGVNPTQVTDFFLATEKVDPNFVVYNGDDIMLLPTIVQGAMGIVSGGAHIFGHEIRAIFEAFEKGENEKAKELFVPMYRFCKTTGQNGRILPNSLLRPAIEAVTGIKLGPARLPLAPATEAELDVTLGVLRELGKL